MSELAEAMIYWRSLRPAEIEAAKLEQYLVEEETTTYPVNRNTATGLSSPTSGPTSTSISISATTSTSLFTPPSAIAIKATTKDAMPYDDDLWTWSTTLHLPNSEKEEFGRHAGVMFPEMGTGARILMSCEIMRTYLIQSQQGFFLMDSGWNGEDLLARTGK
jgi:hypothetical protein